MAVCHLHEWPKSVPEQVVVVVEEKTPCHKQSHIFDLSSLVLGNNLI